tara:strand:+ start:594 stop:1793 length:1200 start_codon:yes stop_codon:yes gene_type:complete
MKQDKVDFLIIGAGIIGLTIARELIYKFPKSKIIILEKENQLAAHSSGRNSGVLHAGFYYTADSLKARFSRDGNYYMKEYCEKNNLKINYSKKAVVAQNKSEVATIYELHKRGIKNGVDVKIINQAELDKLDSNIKTTEIALYSPNTATVDPIEVCLMIAKEIESKGVKILYGESYKFKFESYKIKTSKNRILVYDRLINCAGLYADKIAKQYNFSKKYTIVPFKGIYLKYTGKNKPVSMNVYPVPNLNNPFLGVHFTITVDGDVKIGPTSIPAFWRENYSGLENFKFKEFIDIVGIESLLFMKNKFNFRKLATQEIKKYNRNHFLKLASPMLKKFDPSGFNQWIRPGIRAQLLDTSSLELLMDFVIEGDESSTHILNAVSPAFTCSMPFSKFIVNKYF